MSFKRLFKNKWKFLVASTGLMAISSLDGITSPYFLGEITNQVNDGEFEKLPLTLLLWGVSLTLILIAMTLDKWVYGQIVLQTNMDMKNKILYKAFTKEGLKQASSSFSASILSNVKEIETSYLMNVKGIIYCILQASITLSFLLYINWQVGLIFIFFGIFPAVIPKMTSKWLQKFTDQWQASNKSYVKVLEDSLESRKTVKRQGIEGIIFKRIFPFLNHMENMYLAMRIHQSLVSNFMLLIYVWSIVLSFYFSIRLVASGQVSAGVLLTAYMSADRVTSPIISIAQFYNQMITVKPMVEDIYRQMPQEELQQREYTDSELIKIESGSIQFGQRQLFDQFNMQIQQGDRILLRGASGTGKSTLLKVLLGEVPLSSGKVYYSKEIDEDLYQSIGIIDQNPYVFNDTLKFNLTFGRSYEQEYLFDILNKVELSHLANEDALQEMVGKDGRLLSNGEIKRLELARLLIQSKTILLVDEVLSGLDEKHAQQVQRIIFENFDTVIDVEHHIAKTALSYYNKVISI